MNSVFFRFVILFGLAFIGMVTISPAQTQIGQNSDQTTAEPKVEAPSPNDLKELSRLLSDPGVIEWLRKSAAGNTSNQGDTPSEGSSYLDQIDVALERTRKRITKLAQAWRRLPDVPALTVTIWQSQINGSETLRSIAFTIIFLFVGAGLEWLFWQYFTALLLHLEFDKNRFLWQRVRSALMRATLVIGALMIFGVGSIGTFLMFDWPPLVQRIVLNLLIAIIAVRTILALAKFVLASKVPELRFVPLSSGPAKRLYRWVGYVTSAVVFGVLISNTLAYLAVVDNPTEEGKSAALAVSVLAAFAIAALLLVAVWRIGSNAKYTGRADSSTTTPLRTQSILLSVLIIVSLVLWLVGARELMWSLIIIGLTIPTIALASRLINHLFDQAEGEVKRPSHVSENFEEEGEQNAENDTGAADYGRYDLIRPITIRLARFVLALIALLALGGAWGVSVLSLSASTTLAGRVFGIMVNVTVALLIADLIWVWAKTAIDRRLADFNDSMGAMGGEGGGAAGPEARMATLLPILRKILMVTIIIMVALSVMSALGLNIAPLLAGAGVVGVAIGFGAQSLVRDIVSGIFYLLDDAFRVGEYIEMGELRGTVESMSLRSLRVRHHRGAIHTIPFGELSSLTNYSRDWVIMKQEFRVPFDTDIKLVKRLVKQVGAELQANEIYGKHFIQPLKSQGVRRMEEFNMVIGTKFMCVPGEQWVIRRDAFQKLRDIFEQNGIELAQRNVKVEVVSDQPVGPEIKEAIAGAAQEAAEQQVAPVPPSDEP